MTTKICRSDGVLRALMMFRGPVSSDTFLVCRSWLVSLKTKIKNKIFSPVIMLAPTKGRSTYIGNGRLYNQKAATSKTSPKTTHPQKRIGFIQNTGNKNEVENEVGGVSEHQHFASSVFIGQRTYKWSTDKSSNRKSGH